MEMDYLPMTITFHCPLRLRALFWSIIDVELKYSCCSVFDSLHLVEIVLGISCVHIWYVCCFVAVCSGY